MRSGVLTAAMLILLVVAVPVGAQAARSSPVLILGKAGGGFDERATDQARCRAIAEQAPVEDLPQAGAHASASGYAADLPTAVGGLIAFAIIAAIDTSRARGLATAFCLTNLGYVGIPLTPEESRTYAGLAGRDREGWERTFLAQDLKPRIDPLVTPSVPPLPPYRQQTGAQGGLKVELASLAVSEGPFKSGDRLATGKLTHWRKAVLSAPFETIAGPIQLSGSPGTMFHQVDYRPQRAPLLRNQGATWCGPVVEKSQGQRSTQLYCFTTHADGYEPFRPTGYDWLAGPYRDGIVLPRFTSPMVLEERGEEDADTIDLEVMAVQINASRVTLAAYAKRNNRSIRIWGRTLTFDQAGEAILPLWSHRLLIRKIDTSSVSATIDELGDGQSWREGD